MGVTCTTLYWSSGAWSSG